MKSKLISSILIGALACSMMAGCGSSSAATEAKSEAPAAEAKSEAPAAEEETAAESEAAEEEAAAEEETVVDYGPAMELTMGSTGAVEDISTQSAQYFCDLVAEKSGGNIKINLFPASQLGAQLDQMEMLSQGSIDLFLEANMMGSFGINTGASTTLFVSRSREDFAKIIESDVYAEWQQRFLEETGIRMIAKNWFRNHTAIASKNKIETIEDMAGVKLRVPPVQSSVDMFSSIGFNATPVAYSETLISLQQGVIDAVWCTEDAIWTMGFYEPANYVFELQSGGDNMIVYMNDALYQSMTEAQQNLITECALEAGDYYSGLSLEVLATNKANWEAAGVETITIDEETANKIAEVTFAAAYKNEEEGVWAEGTFDRIRAITGY